MNFLIVLAICGLFVEAKKRENEIAACRDRQLSYEANLGGELKLEFKSPYFFENGYFLKMEIRGPGGILLCKNTLNSDGIILDPESRVQYNQDCVVFYDSGCKKSIFTIPDLRRDKVGKWNVSTSYYLMNGIHTDSYFVDVYGIEFDETFHNKSFEVNTGGIIAVYVSEASRSSSNCMLFKKETSEIYDLNSDSYRYPENNTMIERILKCGFRMVVDNTSEGNWSLSGDFGWIIKRVYFEVITNSLTVRNFTEMLPSHQIWYDDFYVASPYEWNFLNITYIEMERSDKKYVNQAKGSIYHELLPHVTMENEGSWKLHVLLENETYIREQDFHVKIEDIPVVMRFSWYLPSADVNRTSHQLIIHTGDNFFNDCRLKNQNGTFFESIFEGLVKGSMSVEYIFNRLDNVTITGELEILCNIDTGSDGYELILNGLITMKGENYPMNGTHHVISPVWYSLRKKKLVIRGNELKVKCIASRPLTNCTLVSPNGIRYMQSDNSSLLIEKKCSRGEGICGWVKIIKNVEEIHAGNWTCEMDLEGGRRIESIVPVDVKEYPIVTRHAYSNNGDIKLYCLKPSTMFYGQIRRCRWFDSHGKYIPNPEEPEETFDRAISRIVLNVSNGKLSGIYKCAVRLDKYIKGEIYGYFNLSEISSNAPKRYFKQMKDSIEEQGKSPKNVGVILYSLAVVMIILTMGILIIYKYKVGNLSAELSRTKAGPLNPGEMLHEQADFLPYDEERWEYPENKLQMGKKLGNGFFGFVVEALAPNILKDGKCTRVAVKKLQPIANLLSDRRDLEIELKVLANLPKHTNIVNLLGACTKSTAPGGLLVILEFCDLGNLLNYIIQNRSKYIDLYNPSARMDDDLKSKPDTQQRVVGNDFYPKIEDLMSISQNIFSTQDLLTWSLQAAKGMDYLSKKNVLHGDLAARNILLTDERVAKICDFGLARTIPECDYYRRTGSALPLRWMALESLLDRKFSTQSDVWSFGVVLWECFTLGKSPYEGMDALKIVHNLGNGKRLGMPDYATDEIYNIMRRCWNLVPSDRPSFSTIIQDLGGIIDRISKRSSKNMERYSNYENLK